MSKLWIALYSHSGTELSEILKNSKDLTIPYAIFSNQKMRKKVNPAIYPLTEFLSHPDIMEEIMNTAKATTKEIVITLHGYMRIIPPEIIALPNVSIYNVHPGDIVKYPELRGADPQKKALELGLPTTGVVIHHVDEGVDTGKIVLREVYQMRNWTDLNVTVDDLRQISIDMWIKFLRNIL